MNKEIFLVLVITFLSSVTNAAFIDNDTFTTDTQSGLDWMDTTLTQGLSYNEVVAQTGIGGKYEGWRHAYQNEVYTLFGNAGGNGVYEGWSAENNGVAAPLVQLLGNNYDESRAGQYSITTGWVQPVFVRDGNFGLSYALLYDIGSRSATEDRIWLPFRSFIPNYSQYDTGHFLVRTSAVPVPAAAWLFGSALVGLIGFKRKSS